MVVRVAHSAFPFMAYPQEPACNYRKTYRYLTIGFSYKVTVVFAESLLQSDRGRSYKVTVDKLAYPKGL